MQQNPNRGRDPVGEFKGRGWTVIGSGDDLGFAEPSGRADEGTEDGPSLRGQEPAASRDHGSNPEPGGRGGPSEAIVLRTMVHAPLIGLPTSASTMASSSPST